MVLSKRSSLQKAHASESMTRINTLRQTQSAASSTLHQDSVDTLYHLNEIRRLQEELANLRIALRNMTRVAKRAKISTDLQRKKVRRVLQAKEAQTRRIKNSRRNLKARGQLNQPTLTFHLKENGIVKDNVRGMIRKLATLNVPEQRICDVIYTVSEGFGIMLHDNVSRKTVSRAIMEGGLASEMQIVAEIEKAKGLTLSGDGTTIRHRNYESRHVTLQCPSDTPNASDQNTFQTRFLGIGTAPSHSSEHQLLGLQSQINTLYTTYNKSPLGQTNPANVDLFATYIRGLGTDHAEDQKKLARLIEMWKIDTDLRVRGEHAVNNMSLQEVLPFLLKAATKKIADAGGLETWENLSQAEKDHRDKLACEAMCREIGEQKWDKLLEETKHEARLFIWSGCCMHKEMNSVKGGARTMAEFWTHAGINGPVKLMNRDNAAAAAAGPSAARDHAIEVSEGGAIKLSSLAGNIFNHKDDKKGQQDTYRMWFEERLGFTIHFPDTSNTRFGSHCEAAAELVVHLPLYLEFLMDVRDSKEKRNFNHMESNVFKGLTDAPTLTELCVLVLYSQAISHPYMQSVRGSGKRSINALDLGPLHSKVLSHCKSLLHSPDLLLSPDASHKMGTLDGTMWQRPEAFYTVLRLSPSLPFLKPCLMAFLQGALETWRRFVSEFDDGGTINGLTVSQRKSIWICPTNDHNEGKLGAARVAFRSAPNLSIEKHNAKQMYKHNDTHSFVANRLSANDQKYLRTAARARDESNIGRKKRVEEVEHIRRVVKEKRRKAAKHQEILQAREHALEILKPELDIECLKQGLAEDGKKLTKEKLIQQINWHRRFDTTKKIPIKTLVKVMKSNDILTLLIPLVIEFKTKGPEASNMEQTPILEEGNLDKYLTYEEQEELDDRDMEDF